MQALEALTRVLSLAGELHGLHVSHRPQNEEPDREQEDVAVAICTAMLNTAVPIARYRCFVRIEKTHPRQDNGSEYTICATSMGEIIAALRLLSHHHNTVMITLFEQRSNGADMICGFQGRTKDLAGRFTRFLEQLPTYDIRPAVN